MARTTFEFDDDEIPPELIELFPASLAWENRAVPIGWQDGVLSVAATAWDDKDLEEKLRFILNTEVRIVLTPRESIQRALDRYYPQDAGDD